MDQAQLLDGAERIDAAIARSGRTLESLANQIGCSHVTLVNWRSGKTPVETIKAGLLLAFADATGVEVRWLLTGQGPMIARYTVQAEIERVGAALKAMERTAPQQIETVVRMVEAAAGSKSPG